MGCGEVFKTLNNEINNEIERFASILIVHTLINLAYHKIYLINNESIS